MSSQKPETKSTSGGPPDLRFGLALPNYRPGASAEDIAAAAETAQRLGWESIWTTDHVLPDTVPRSQDYGHLFEALATLAWLSRGVPRLRLGTSVLVVPMRNAVVLAKELASLDVLSGGRVTVGVGVGWNETEYSNLGLTQRFHERGRYLDEAMALWRHVWSGSREPFRGRFHTIEDFAAGPLPTQGAALPIWVGGRSDPAYRRAGRSGDAYHSSAVGPGPFAERVTAVRAAARDAGRPEPVMSARVRVPPPGVDGGAYVMSGSPRAMLAELDDFAAAGAAHMVIDFVETDPERHTARFEQFHREVASARMAS